MAITAPWDLVTAATIPLTVEWWSLRGQPDYPPTLQTVLPLKNNSLVSVVEYGPPQIDPTGHVAWRTFTASWFSPNLDSEQSIDMGYAAVVDPTGAFPVLVLFPVTPPLDLEDSQDAMVVSGILQAVRI